jgi:hypothetical protein
MHCGGQRPAQGRRAVVVVPAAADRRAISRGNHMRGPIVALVTALLLFTPVISGCASHAASPTSRSATFAEAPVTVHGGGVVRLAGAKLVLPPGAVSADGRVIARVQPASPAPTATAVNKPSPHLLLAATPVQFTLIKSRLIHPATLSFPVSRRALPANAPRALGPDLAWLSYYNPQTHHWQPVPGRYHPATGTVTATVTHLSTWASQTWDWQAIALRLRQSLSAFGSGRAAPQSCPPIPHVSISAVGAPDPPLLGCATQVTSDTLTVTITSNRSYAMVAHAPADATPGPSSYNGFEEWARSRQAVTNVLGGPYLPPAASLTYTIPMHGGTEVFNAASSPKTHVLDEALVAATAVFDAVTPQWVSCVLATVARSQPASFADAPALAVKCFRVLAQAATILTPYLTPIMNNVQTILQTYDRAHDVALKINGQVQITRPSLPLPEFYYASAVQPEYLYVSPSYPQRLGIDNADWIDIQTVNSWGPYSLTMTGVLNYNNCQPSCAGGQMLTFPVQVVATAPQTCSVQVGKLGSTSPEDAYVFSKISVNALSGSPPSFLVGNSVLKVCGAGY